ncbi:hypothetical protein [Chitinimonas sp.]|uniref:hypothetical protein n=1 Tax=Chitinimonas sp. TaxID=1934313 RepID=UPI0035AF9591
MINALLLLPLLGLDIAPQLAHDEPPPPYVSQGSYRTLSCSLSLAPDQLVISGGSSIEGVRPTEVAAQLDRQKAAIQRYLQGLKGSLVEKEHLRAARNVDDVKSGKQPYIHLMRFEALLPVGANADQAIEGLIKLGMDRYGKDANIDDYSQYKVLSSYRATAAKSRITAAREQCLQEQVQACNKESGGKCKQRFELTASQFEARGVVNSENRYFDDAGLQRLDNLDAASAAPVQVLMRLTVHVGNK